MSRVLEEPVRTFSIGFQDEAFDETAHARTVARHVGAQHHEEIVNPDHLAILPELVDHYGEPFGDSSAVPTFHVSRLASAQVKMVLSGDGGDENFAGYPTYAAALTRFPPVVLTRYRRLRHTAANLLRAVRLWPTAPNGRDPREWWYGAVAYFREPERRTLWRPEYRSLTAATRQWLWDAYERSREPDLCSTLQHLDISTYLPFDILTKVDIASMCHGLEVRVPLLDHKLMEAVAEIPWTLKLRMESGDPGSGERRGPCGKYLLKRRAERLVPRDVVYRQKQGFAAPIGRWFQGPLRPAALERLTSPTSPLNAFFEPAELRGLVNANDRDAAHGNRLWAMLFLGEWLEKQVASTASTSWEPMAP
jgi:asparagine synthase (glutamine-hydrolysing)